MNVGKQEAEMAFQTAGESARSTLKNSETAGAICQSCAKQQLLAAIWGIVMARGILRTLFVACTIAMGFGSLPVEAQSDDVFLAAAQEESLDDGVAESIRANIADERARLLLRLDANAPDQTPGAITTSTSELAGRMIANAMRRLLVVQPHGQPIIVAIAPQTEPDGNRQLVLLNLSAWIAKGRNLGIDQMELFAILPDREMRGAGGSPFQLEGVSYFGAVEETTIAFHRRP